MCAPLVKASVGVFGAVVSSLTVCVVIVETLPTLSSASHFTVVVPSATMLKLAVAASTSLPLVTTSLPLIAGAVPSVV